MTIYNNNKWMKGKSMSTALNIGRGRVCYKYTILTLLEFVAGFKRRFEAICKLPPGASIGGVPSSLQDQGTKTTVTIICMMF